MNGSAWIPRGWMVGAAVGAALTAPALAQFGVFSNAGPSVDVPALASASVTASGVSAPGGGLWSEVGAASASESNAFAGVSGQGFGAAGTYRFAEDFTVPTNRSWQLTSVWMYAYQPGAGASASPFSGVSVQVWNGRPGDAGSTVVWGDATTNRLSSAEPTGVYRVFNTTVAPATAPDTTRPIWRLEAATGVTLAAGTYWIDWQVTCIDPLGEAFAPTATIAGARTGAGWNAVQFKPAAPPLTGGVWSPILDPGKPITSADVAQALPLILRGYVRGCVADYDGSGQASIDDLFKFLSGYFTGDPQADINGFGGVTIDDLFLYLNAYFTGCTP